MTHGIWNIRILCWAGSLKTVASEMVKCILGLMAVQEAKLVKGGRQHADDDTFF